MMTTINIDELPAHPDYRALAAIEGMQVDLRYAGTRNLLGRDLYSPHDCAWLRREAADALQRSVRWLALEQPALRLLVLDAARPQRVQELFWAHVQGTTMQPYFAPPQRGSIHSFGMAVDITLADAQGRELDMGTPFDDTTERSHPALEHRHAAAGLLSEMQLSNRRLLRTALLQAGWQAIDTEWWHFDFGDRDEVRRRLPRIV
ncbi:MAG: M15 family metallopeptidase [Rubrivivax sp.]